MTENKNPKQYDLEERTLQFAKDVREFAKSYPKDAVSFDDIRQLIRASGSVGANYIEANESLSKKDLRMRIKICKKEAKECTSWLKLLKNQNKPTEDVRMKLEKESVELTYIFAAILRNSSE
jgi:four helix bundle protein